MKTNRTLLVSATTMLAGLVLLPIACGGGSGLSTHGGASGTNSGGGGGGTGPFGAGGSAGTSGGLCAEVPCWAALINNCTPTGACTMQISTSGQQTTDTVCFDDGIKEQVTVTVGTSSNSGTLIVKKGSSVCFSLEEIMPSNGTTGSYVIRNGSGSQVATATGDISAKTMTMTCTGGQPTLLSAACYNTGGDSNCTSGTCVY